MASLDRPRHGWEGISNGGEIWGNGNSGGSNFDDVVFLIDADSDRLSKILRELEELDKDDKPNLGDVDFESILGQYSQNVFQENLKSVYNHCDILFHR